MSTDRSLAPIADTVQQVEAKLLRKKTELRQFESEYRQVSKHFLVLDCLLMLMHACIGVHQTITGVTNVLTANACLYCVKVKAYPKI